MSKISATLSHYATRLSKPFFRAFYKAMAPLAHQKSLLEPEKASASLQKYFPDNGESPFLKENSRKTEGSTDLSIMIPSFNSRDFIVATLDSVFSQTTKFSFEVIIDDSSTDGTDQILLEYKQHHNIQIMHSSLNDGEANSRNRCLDVASGHYYFFLDSDDELLPGSIELLMKTITEEKADIVEGSYTSVSIDGHLKTYHKSGVGNHLYGMQWGKVYSRRVWKHLRFAPNYTFCDTIISWIAEPLSRKTVFLPESVYLYYSRVGSASKKIHSPRQVQSFYLTRSIINSLPYFELSASNMYERFLKQSQVNGGRILALPKDIQESVFSLTSCLFHKLFFNEPKNQLAKFFAEKDFGEYVNYLKRNQ